MTRGFVGVYTTYHFEDFDRIVHVREVDGRARRRIRVFDEFHNRVTSFQIVELASVCLEQIPCEPRS